MALKATPGEPLSCEEPDTSHASSSSSSTSSQSQRPMKCESCSHDLSLHNDIRSQLRALRISRAWLQKGRYQLVKATAFSNEVRNEANIYYRDVTAQAIKHYQQMTLQGRRHYKMITELAQLQSREMFNRSRAFAQVGSVQAQVSRFVTPEVNLQPEAGRSATAEAGLPPEGLRCAKAEPSSEAESLESSVLSLRPRSRSF